jgi:hypothetical protein
MPSRPEPNSRRNKYNMNVSEKTNVNNSAIKMLPHK